MVDLARTSELTIHSTEDVNALLELLPKFASWQLSDLGSFYPFALAIGSDGWLRIEEADLDDTPAPVDIAELLNERLHDELLVGQVRTFGLCMNVLTHDEKTDTRTQAICLTIVSSEGFNLKYYVPFELLPNTAVLKDGFFRTSVRLLAS